MVPSTTYEIISYGILWHRTWAEHVAFLPPFLFLFVSDRGAKEAVALVVARGPLGVLAPEVALVVAQEEHDLHPAFLGRDAILFLATNFSQKRGTDLGHLRTKTAPLDDGGK